MDVERKRIAKEILSREAVLQILETTLLKHGGYLSTSKLMKASGLDRKTWGKYGIIPWQLMDKLDLLGYKHYSNWPEELKQRQREKIRQLYESMIVERKGVVLSGEVAKRAGISASAISLQFGRAEGLTKMHAKYGIKYLPANRRVGPTTTLEICRNYIIQSNCYKTLDELVEYTGLTWRELYKYIPPIAQLNAELGFKKPKSLFEERIFEALIELGFTDIKREVTFPNLRSQKGRKLRFDFYIESLNFIVEADGQQHERSKLRSSASTWFCSQDLPEKDEAKNDYCISLGWTLTRIPYKHVISIEYVKQFIPIEILKKVQHTKEIMV